MEYKDKEDYFKNEKEPFEKTIDIAVDNKLLYDFFKKVEEVEVSDGEKIKISFCKKSDIFIELKRYIYQLI